MQARMIFSVFTISAASFAATAGSVGYESPATRGGSGDSIGMSFSGIAGGGGAGRVVVDGRTLPTGHIGFQITTGPSAGSQFFTFCIELSQNVGSGPAFYQIVDLTQAPLPGPSYGSGTADQISAVVANAVALGWIDGRLQSDTAQTNYLGRMGAIQAAIWDAIGGSVDINATDTSASVRDAYTQLLDTTTFDSTLRLSGLRALTNSSRQDMLYVVPLPPASLAGVGLMVAGLGIRAARRR